MTLYLTWRIKWRSIGVALMVAWLGAMPTLAEDSTQVTGYDWPILHLGGRVGYITLHDVDDEGSFNIGVTGGAFFLPWLGMDLSIDFQDTEWFFVAIDEPDLAYEIERETVSLQAGLILMAFPQHRVRPYATGGMGYYFSRYTSGYYPAERVSEEGYYAGAGFELSAISWDDDMSFVLETRWLFTAKEQYANNGIHADGFTIFVGIRGKFP
jgi:hypothetical protein